MVVESKWEKEIAAFSKPFSKATTRYFDSKQIDEARKWIAE